MSDDHEPTGMSTGKIVLIVLAIVGGIGLLTCGGCMILLMPALSKARGKAERTKSANNLRQVGVASISYMVQSVGPDGRRGFMPHATGGNTDDGPEHVGVVFARLVQNGEIDDTEVFVCPSSTDIPTRIAGDPAAFSFLDDDVRTSMEFSYGWAKGQVTDGNSRASRIMSADRSRGLTGGQIQNHPDGRNILRFDGSVDFFPVDLEDFDDDMLAELAKVNLADR